MLNAFLNALGGIASLVIVAGVGYFLSGRGIIPAECRKLIPRFITNICLPPYLASTIILHFPVNDMGGMFYGIGLPFLGMAILFGAAFAAGRIIGVSRRHFGLFCACVCNPNTIFIGIPVNQALFGAASMPYVLLYYFASTTFFWTIGNYFISRDEKAEPEAGGKSGGFRWQNLLTPPIWGFLIGLAILLLKIGVPQFAIRACVLIGEMTTPLALIFIGMILQEIGLTRLRPTFDMKVALAGRLLASPLLIWTLLPLFGLPELMGKVFIIQASLPVIMQIPILAAYYGTDPEFGVRMVAMSTLLCAATLPVYMCLL